MTKSDGGLRAVEGSQLLYEWLRQLAESGGECPTNKVIIERFGFSGPSTACRMLEILEEQKLILVTHSRRRRVIQILETGKSVESELTTRPIVHHHDGSQARSVIIGKTQNAYLNRGKDRPYGITPGFTGQLNAGCRFIEGEDFLDRLKRGENIFCGAETQAGKPYCEGHAIRCYQPMTDTQALHKRAA